MMKKRMCGALVALFGMGAAHAGVSDWYVTSRMGYSANVLSDMRSIEKSGLSIGVGRSGTVRRFMGSLGVGYVFAPGWRLEAEYVLPSQANAVRSTRQDATSVRTQIQRNRSHRMMLNLYRDFAFTEQLGLYVNAGLGLASIRADGQVLNQPENARLKLASRSQTKLAWSLGVGASYAPTNSLTFDLGYRYINQGSVRTGNVVMPTESEEKGAYTSGKLATGEVYFGMRYAF